MADPRAAPHRTVAPPQSGGLRIPIVSALGRGQTPISSFDDALRRCGVHNYNLIALSSVIPPRSEIVPAAYCARPPEEFGDRLYVVKADARASEPGSIVAAGIGWQQWQDGRGVFVETEMVERRGSCATVQRALTAHLQAALRDLCVVRDVAYAEERGGTRVIVGQVGALPTTALVLAVYRAERWRAAVPIESRESQP